jgi:polar amino acid transport system permease protein
VAVISFAISESAASSEIIRASILSVARGQWDAARVLGMGSRTTYRLVVLPQALRIAIPPLFNDFINNLKSTALVAFVGVFDLFYTTQTIYEQNFQIMPLLIVMTSWYLIIIFVANVIQILIERRYNERLGKLGARQ